MRIRSTDQALAEFRAVLLQPGEQSVDVAQDLLLEQALTLVEASEEVGPGVRGLARQLGRGGAFRLSDGLDVGWGARVTADETMWAYEVALYRETPHPDDDMVTQRSRSVTVGYEDSMNEAVETAVRIAWNAVRIAKRHPTVSLIAMVRELAATPGSRIPGELLPTFRPLPLKSHRRTSNPDQILPAGIAGQLVRVHYNLHRCPQGRDPKPGEACWVVSTKQGGAWKVAGYVPSLLIEEARFQVSKPGVARIRAAGSRAVIAWIVGTAVDPDTSSGRRATGHFEDWRGVGFNPFKADHFYVYDTGKKIEHAPLIYLSGRKASAKLQTSNPSMYEVAGGDDLELMIAELGADVSY